MMCVNVFFMFRWIRQKMRNFPIDPIVKIAHFSNVMSILILQDLSQILHYIWIFWHKNKWILHFTISCNVRNQSVTEFCNRDMNDLCFQKNDKKCCFWCWIIEITSCQSQPECNMQTSLIWMRRQVIRRLIQIKAVWRQDIFNSEWHWSTLKTEADE